MNKKRGIIYYCDGSKKHLAELRHSIRSLRHRAPKLSVALVSEQPLDLHADLSIIIEKNSHPLQNKVRSLLLSPFEETLYLDVDTEICKPLNPVFDFLKNGDIFLANEPFIDYSHRPPLFIAHQRKDEFNTGVILFKKTRDNVLLLEEWHEKICKYAAEELIFGEFDDQTIFNQLVSRHQHNIATLDNCIYNVRYWIYRNMTPEQKKDIAIKHWHLMNRSWVSLKMEEYYYLILRKFFRVNKEQIM